MTGRRAERIEVALLLTLTFATGIVDAVGYLELDRVFMGNMTGNTVLLGAALAGSGGLRAAGLALALAAFWAGAAVCGRALRSRPQVWTARTTALFGSIGLGVGVVGVLVARTPPEPSSALALAAAGVLGACMGVQAATVQHLGVVDVPTSAIDEQVTGLAADAGRRRDQPWARRALSIVLLGSGALVGALLLRAHIGLALGVAAGLAVAVAAVGQALLVVRAPR
ncbi:YoaK family protein [Cellulomonas cellasea]|uniref:YoaK family protein n=1 Tax=Cellulomonas cellasea TaxID=43670 RepID=UPI0025A3880C|nr:YoaK family protein [Cellulomonas cellasea]MDM8084615.1 YoaK family protein [Cellulomonas cellasea]